LARRDRRARGLRDAGVARGLIFFEFQAGSESAGSRNTLCDCGGAVLGFLVFNFNPAKILAGTSGAWFFGFILASLSIFAGAKIATAGMAALIPILDLIRVVWERWQANQSIFQKDRRHLHYLLLNAGLGSEKYSSYIFSPAF